MRTNQFLTSFSLCAFLLAMAGCTDESQLTGTDAGETDTPVSLTIRTTMTDFAGLPEPGRKLPGLHPRHEQRQHHHLRAW